MALLTGDEYLESLEGLHPEVYMRGQRVDRVWDHPLLRQTINHMRASYDRAADPANGGKYAVHSSLVDEDVPRVQMHIQTSMDDVLVKARLTREISSCQICSGCMSNMLSVTWAMIHDIDQAHGTDFHPRFRDFVAGLQKGGKVIAWGMMDPKGNRKLRPHEQNPPTDLRVVEQKPGGIIVSGAKVHTTFGPAAHEFVAVPCRALGPEDKDFAVSFAVPIDTPGLKLIARPSPGPARATDMESPLSSKFLGVEAMSIFDNVFVPWERVFMCGQWKQAGNLPLYFASLHRQSKCACSAGHADLFAGAAALVARANGLSENSGHIREKITDMIMAAETAFGCAMGAAAEGAHHPSGVFMPNASIANCGLNHIRSTLGDHLAALHDIAGGLVTTMPTEADWQNPALRPYIERHLAAGDGFSTEDRLRTLNLCQDLAASRLTGTILGFTVNAAGSPETNRLVARGSYDLESRINMAKDLAGISSTA